MTTIAVSRTEIACDQQATHSSGYKLKVQTKVHWFHNPQIYPKPFFLGFAGSLEDAHSIIEWFANPIGKPPKTRYNEYIILTEDKKIFTFANPLSWVEIVEPFYSIGTGAAYALGALHAGKTPKEAVNIAIKCDPSTGMGTKSFSFEKKEKGA